MHEQEVPPLSTDKFSVLLLLLGYKNPIHVNRYDACFFWVDLLYACNAFFLFALTMRFGGHVQYSSLESWEVTGSENAMYKEGGVMVGVMKVLLCRLLSSREGYTVAS